MKSSTNTFQNVHCCIENLGISFLNLPLYEFKTLLLSSKSKSGKKTKNNADFTDDIEYISEFLSKVEDLGSSKMVTKEATSVLNYLSDRKEFWSQHPLNKNKHWNKFNITFLDAIVQGVS